MKEELIHRIEKLKKDYFFQIEPVDIFNENVLSCAFIAPASEGYWISDNVAHKIHRYDINFKYAYSLKIDVYPVGIFDNGNSTLYLCDAKKKIVLSYTMKEGFLSNISQGIDIQNPLFVSGSSLHEIYVSDSGCIWKYEEKQWRKIIEIDGLYVRYLNVIDEKVFIYDGNSHILYIFNRDGRFLKQILFRENSICGNRLTGFECDPTSLIFYISQGKSIYKYNRNGELLFIANIKKDFPETADIKRLFLSSFENRICLYLVIPNQKRMYRAFI